MRRPVLVTAVSLTTLLENKLSITPFPSQGQYPWYDQLEQWGSDTQSAAENATIAADQVHADVAGAVADAQAAQVAATNAAGLVGAPAGSAVLAAISEGGVARGELIATIGEAVEEVFTAGVAEVGAKVRPLLSDKAKIVVTGESNESQFGALIPDFITDYGWGGLTVHNYAQGGSRIEQNMCQVGAIEVLLTFPSNIIPASGAVTVTVTGLPAAGNLMVTYGLVEGVDGRLFGSSGVYTWTRTTAGEAVPVHGGVRFRVYPKADRLSGNLDGITFVGAGKNTIYGGESAALVNAGTEVIIDALTPKQPTVILVGLHVDTGASGTHGARVAAINGWREQYAAARDGFHYISLGDYVTGSEVWTDVGVTPDATSLAQQAAGELPHQLTDDNIHLTLAAREGFVERIVMPLLGELTGNRGKPAPGTVLTSDTYTGGDGTISGRASSAALGGAPMVPSGQNIATVFAILDGELTTLTASGGLAVFDTGGWPDVEVSAKYTTLQQGLYLVARCQSDRANDDNSRYELVPQGASSVRLRKVVDGVGSYIGVAQAGAAGDTWSLRAVGDQISVLKNGVMVETITDSSVPGGDYAGFLKTTLASAAVVDDLVITYQ